MLQIVQLKPNPTGKDRGKETGASAAQLGAEWVDFKNTGSAPVNLNRMELYHQAYSAGSSEPKWVKITSFSGTLPVGEIVRVHSGRERERGVLYQDDLVGAHHHIFSGVDAYVWNNRRADTAGLWSPSDDRWIDLAGYDASPPEGVILVRSGSKLVPGRVASRY
ncbi:MAG: hypothetical protein IT349_20535 [Candidatus Eisenbacteria bacterium]|nr:hypothetical protein [Candidatus Eisenbacteria bacterium]